MNCVKKVIHLASESCSPQMAWQMLMRLTVRRAERCLQRLGVWQKPPGKIGHGLIGGGGQVRARSNSRGGGLCSGCGPFRSP